MGLSLDEMAAKLSGIEWKPDHKSFVAECPLNAAHVIGVSKLIQACRGGCTNEKIQKFFANGSGVAQSVERSAVTRVVAGSTPAAGAKTPGSSNGRTAGLGPANAGSNPAPGTNGNGYHPPAVRNGINSDDILRRVPPQNLEAEQSVLGAILLENETIHAALKILSIDDFYRESHKLVFRGMLALTERNQPIDAITLTNVLRTKDKLEQIGGSAYLAELASVVPTASNIDHYAQIVRDMSAKRTIASKATWLASLAYDGVSIDALRGEMERALQLPAVNGGSSELVILEDHEDALVANEEYLKQEAVIGELCYTQSISLAVGGKHHGKTTNVRTVALSVLRGLNVWGRKTMQTPVIYAASDDEVAVTRMQLLKMGWNAKTDPLTLVRMRPEVKSDPERVLEQIATAAINRRAKLIILDMLFDFANIKDEMGYAHTREAIGKIQTLANVTGAHVLSTHHSPKYMTDATGAATAALGSQGIAARFSPIILTRKWADDLFTVESTMTRDPRGIALKSTCIAVDENGWAQTTGEFKSWMKWKLFRARVLPLFESLEPGKTLSVREVAETLEISRPDAQNACYQMFKTGELDRQKSKRGAERYWLKGNQGLFEPDEV